MFTQQQLTDMLNMQNEVNKAISKTDSTPDQPYMLAAALEAGECVDHIGWKWWKKQECDLPQAQMELIDIWHFMLSEVLSTFRYSTEEGKHEALSVPPCPVTQPRMADAVKLVSQLMENCLAWNANKFRAPQFQENITVVFEKCCAALQLTPDTIYQKYIQKNVLNLFRLNHGYQDGTYIKEWFGKEDNEVLTELSSVLDNSHEEFAATLYEALEYEYGLVKKDLYATHEEEQ